MANKSKVTKLFVAYKEKGDQKSKEIICKLHINLVYKIAHKYCFDKGTLDDLIQEGMLGLLDAIETFDYKRGLKFTTHCTTSIFKKIYIASYYMRYKCKIPENYFHFLNKVSKLEGSIEDIVIELSHDKWNMSDDVAKHIAFLSKNEPIISYDRTEDMYRLSLNKPNEECADIEDYLDCLSDDERDIICSVYGIYPYTQRVDKRKIKNKHNMSLEELEEEIEFIYQKIRANQ